MQMVIESRRRWLQWTSLLAGGALLPTPPAWARSAETPVPRVLTAWNENHQSWAGVWTPNTQRPQGIALPARAHELLTLPGHGQALVIARRPGEYLLRMDCVRNSALQWHTMEEDRYLGGHAVLAADGRTFFTTETDASTGAGIVAQRDLVSLQKLREFPSGGIGPHALLREPDGNLLVANGGILNLPETGRRKLNVGQMDSNLSRIAPHSGALLAQYRLPDPLLSLRHLARAADGTVGVALQAEHVLAQDRHGAPALALLQGAQLRTVPWTETASCPSQWDGYAGDICYTGTHFWLSAPHAGYVFAWDLQGKLAYTHQIPQVNAVSCNGTHCIAAGSQAAVFSATSHGSPTMLPLHATWDNHAVLLPQRGV